MEFDSIVFLFRFLPFFLILYFAAPGRMKNVVLLFGSLLFCAWGNPICAIVLAISVAVNYALGLGIAARRGTRAAAGLLIAAVVLNGAALLFTRVAPEVFLAQLNLTGVSYTLPGPGTQLGFAVYTFQVLSYLLEIDRCEVKPQKNFLDFAVYATFFPVMAAGPIVKYQEMEASLPKRHTDAYRISGGARRIAVGLAKKAFLADQFGLLWEEVRGMDYAGMSLMSAWLGIVAFALQLYFALSGYADMAIGLGELMGFSLPENFDYPYAAHSITGFWRKWYGSLGRWLRDYVYIPLGGSRRDVLRMMRNILIVWGIAVLWCGLSLNTLLWGLWFTVWLILEKLFLKELLDLFPTIVGWLYTMIVVMVGWVLLELDTARDILLYLRAMFDWMRLNVADTQGMFLMREYGILLAIGILAMLPVGGQLRKQLEKSETGGGIAVCRFANAVFPAALLLLSIAYIL